MRDTKPIGLIEIVALSETPAANAVIVAVPGEVDAIVLIVKDTVVAPGETVTVDGTVARGLLDDRLTTIPFAGAGRLIVMVPDALLPPTTDFGEMVKTSGTGIPRTLSTRPLKLSVPQPDAVSHPGPAFDALPLGKVPLLPEVMS